MTANGLLQIAIYLAALLLLVKPLGAYMARVYEGQPPLLGRLLGPFERWLYRFCGVKPDREMDWKTYAAAMLLFSLAGMLLLYLQQRLQAWLPLNPQGMANVGPDSAFNTAASFTTNTNWQAYAGESTMSYLTQMAGLAVHNFTSAAAGLAVAVALIRGLARHECKTIGNFWVDLTRSTLYILLPSAFVLALVLVSCGVIQNFDAYREVRLIQPTTISQPQLDAAGKPVLDAAGQPVMQQVRVETQTLAMGPVASQMAIKHLGTNGGGFFNANAAHPYENPSPLTDFLLVLSQTAIAAGLTYTFGRMVGDTRQGWAVLAAMMVILVAGLLAAYAAEAQPNPRLAALGVDAVSSDSNPGGNMEGKEARFGVARSALFAVTTTATSCGAVNSMHDSFMPLGGLVPLVMMHLGETVLGGVGSGLYGMLVFVIAAVFVSGLMVGRTPEYLGKKIGAAEMKLASIIILIMPAAVLALVAVAVSIEAGRAGPLAAQGAPHAFSEVLYAFTSMTNNNGSAFAGLSANTPFYNVAGAAAMLVGRFWLAIPTLAIAGAMAAKKKATPGPGTLATHSPVFVTMLVATVVVVGALTFLPALALGPVAEHFELGSQPQEPAAAILPATEHTPATP